MINLAGRRDAELYVWNELETAGIKIVRDKSNLDSEVSVLIAGQLGSFHFTRAWYYWVVSGNVPLEVAQELYQSELGKKDVRVVGHCSCPPPEDWTTWLGKKGVQLITPEEDEKIKSLFSSLKRPIPTGYLVVPKEDFPKVGHQYITGYHIDSQAGLNLFVRTLKHHKLV